MPDALALAAFSVSVVRLDDPTVPVEVQGVAVGRRCCRRITRRSLPKTCQGGGAEEEAGGPASRNTAEIQGKRGAHPEGFEPPTPGSEDQCSIR